ncbi:unnamed protein product [Caenorhabditis angaria]|uniref:Uncharacterized protein n=1 Tax=Caenorhabditis angaria TaxID=860376 RepID=A0A9P1MVD3_9PELO|nr:unnamed protein product [Caenorhabditis angaria]
MDPKRPNSCGCGKCSVELNLFSEKFKTGSLHVVAGCFRPNYTSEKTSIFGISEFRYSDSDQPCKGFLVSHRLLGQMSEMEDAPSLSKSQIRLGSHMSPSTIAWILSKYQIINVQ